jgi:uncharacterized protein
MTHKSNNIDVFSKANSTKFLLLFGVVQLSGNASAFTVPKLTAPVVDQADVIDETTEKKLNEILKQVLSSGGSQIGVLTVKTIDNLSIEEASIKVADAWKLGDARRDDGVLLILALKERKLRIEVGQGKEGDLPDLYAKRIIEQVIVPELKNNRLSYGIKEGVYHILTHTDAEWMRANGLALREMKEKQEDDSSLYALIGAVILFGIFFGLFAIVDHFFPKLTSSRSGHSRGGRSGGSSGSSGYSGGGGGFSGGGASGGW